MAYNPITKLWEPEDDTITPRLTGLLASDSPLMKQAETAGLMQANKRGLLNSSMAVGAAQAEANKVAMPIASQEAGQTFQKNMSSQGSAQTGVLQEGEQAAAKERLGMQIGSQETLAGQEQEAAKERLGMQLNTQTDLAGKEIVSKEKVAGMNVAASDREKSAAAVAQFSQTYAQMFAEISKNNDMPAETRQRYLVHLGALRDQSLQLAEQLFGIDLKWTPTVA